jgi:hypothetical protein
MAVVQISRIQIRRGQKNSGTGFPQLASGELGWAVDTQELYIGNGAVSEGAPYVGNTKIVTETDNILEVQASYTYQKNSVIVTGPNSYTPVARTLQERLDEVVDVKSFGAIGDGIHDDTVSIQRALDQLYLNPSTKDTVKNRVILSFGPGTYKVTEELKIPPFAHIAGAGIDSTIIKQYGDYALWRTVDSNSIPPRYTPFSGTYSAVRPRYITVEGVTFFNNTANTIGYLDNADFSTFKNVKFEGIYHFTSNPAAGQTGVYIRSTGVLETANTMFDFCMWANTGYGIFSDTNSSNISITNSHFYQLWDGINLGGGTTGARYTKVIGCYFDLIYRYGYLIKKGIGNTSTDNKYINVGNLNQSYKDATYPIIQFNTQNNLSTDDYFERSVFLRDHNQAGTVEYVANIKSKDLIQDNRGFSKVLSETVGSNEFYRFPVYESGVYLLDYVINKGPTKAAVRSGQIRINVDLRNFLSTSTDSYDYTGDSSVENIYFSSVLQNYSAATDSIPDTLSIMVSNPLTNGGGIVNCSFRMLTQGTDL